MPDFASLPPPLSKHVVFDLDGTLTDPAPGIVACYRHVQTLLELPVSDDTALRRLIGPPLRAALAGLLASDDPTQVEHAVTLYRERFATTGLYENAVYPGVLELLAVLQQAGYTLWIATSKAHVYAREIARHFAFDGYFSGIYGAELTGERSNKAELLAHLLQSHGLDPRHTVMIGDREHDVLAAKAHGIHALGVLWGYGSRDELEAAGADSIACSIADLHAAITAALATVT